MGLALKRPLPRSPKFPISASANGRYLLNGAGVPFLPMGDGTGQTLCQLIPSDVDFFLRTRESQGFNAIWMHAVTNSGNGPNVTANAATRDGIKPFTGVLSGSINDAAPVYDFTTPNSVYFARLDQIIQLAALHGIVVYLGVFDNDSFLSVMQANGNANMAAWGAFLGARYASSPNVIYLTGNDFQSWRNTASDVTLAQNVMAGIAANDPKLQALELDYNMSGGLENTTLAPYQGLATAYSYYPTYYQVGQEYASPVKTIPAYLVETYYEGIPYGNLTPSSASNLMLRKIAYWTVLAGGLAGVFYGSKWWDFGTGWQSGLATTAVTHYGLWKQFFQSIPWFNLVPDSANVVVTAGFGTATGNNAGRIDTDTYVTTSRSPDGKFVVAYLPVNTTITVDMTKLVGTSNWQWFDPTTGTYSSAATGLANTGTHNFTTSTNNAAGDPDWVLVGSA